MRKGKLLILVMMICFILCFALGGCSDQTKSSLSNITGRLFSPSRLSSSEELDLRSSDGVNYTFTYDGEDYYAEYLTDTWTVYNSYQIKSSKDIRTICSALCEEHQVPSRDGESYRTPKDMAYEWEQHNIAYDELPEGNYWRECARNVDLDPDDQGKNFKEIYEERTGNKLDLDTVIEHQDQIKNKIEEKLGSENINLDNVDFEKLNAERIKEKLKQIIKKIIEDE